MAIRKQAFYDQIDGIKKATPKTAAQSVRTAQKTQGPGSQ